MGDLHADDLDMIEQAAANATPGRRAWTTIQDAYGQPPDMPVPAGMAPFAVYDPDEDDPPIATTDWEADAAYIAAVPPDVVLALVAKLRWHRDREADLCRQIHRMGRTIGRLRDANERKQATFDADRYPAMLEVRRRLEEVKVERDQVVAEHHQDFRIVRLVAGLDPVDHASRACRVCRARLGAAHEHGCPIGAARDRLHLDPWGHRSPFDETSVP